MITSLSELYSLIKNAEKLQDVKSFFDHIELGQDEGQEDELHPPYIVITNTSEPAFFADDIVYYNALQGEVVYIYKNFEDEHKEAIEELLNQNEISFTITHEFDEDLRLFVTRYAYEISGGADDGIN